MIFSEIADFIDCLLKRDVRYDERLANASLHFTFLHVQSFYASYNEILCRKLRSQPTILYLKASLNILSPVDSQFLCYSSIRNENLKKPVRDLCYMWYPFELPRNIEEKCYRSTSSMISRISRDRSIWIMDDPCDDSRR